MMGGVTSLERKSGEHEEINFDYRFGERERKQERVGKAVLLQ